MVTDEHLNLLMPFGIHEGETINSVMEENPFYLAWFVDNIHKLEGHSSLVDTLVEQIKTHSRFPRVWARYVEGKRRDSERAHTSRKKEKKGERRGGSQRLEWNCAYVPQVRLVDTPLLLELYRWCFSGEEMQGGIQTPADFPLVGLQAQVKLHQRPYFKDGKAVLAGKTGWLELKVMHVKTQPACSYLLAAAATFHHEQIDPFMLVRLFDSATETKMIASLSEEHLAGDAHSGMTNNLQRDLTTGRKRARPIDMQRELANTLKCHREASLMDWQEKRMLYLESLVHDLEVGCRRLRASRDRSDEKARLRAALVEAEAQELEAERNYLLGTPAAPELEVTKLFDLEWAVFTRAE